MCNFKRQFLKIFYVIRRVGSFGIFRKEGPRVTSHILCEHPKCHETTFKKFYFLFLGTYM